MSARKPKVRDLDCPTHPNGLTFCDLRTARCLNSETQLTKTYSAAGGDALEHQADRRGLAIEVDPCFGHGTLFLAGVCSVWMSVSPKLRAV